MKKLSKNSKVLEVLVALIVILAIAAPIGMVLAETPSTTSTVAVDQGLVLGESYQRHSYEAASREWVWWANDSAIVYSSSDDAYTWTTPTIFSPFVCNEGVYCCNSTSFSLWYDWTNNYVHVAYMNITGAAESIWYARGKPFSDGTIVWNESQEAVVGLGSFNYSVPSICITNLGYPYIAYMSYDENTHYLESWLSSSATEVNTSHIWTSATNSTINCSVLLNDSYEISYPSVIPVASGNVSVLYVIGSIGDYPYQNFALYNVSSDLWEYNDAVAVLAAPGDMPYPWKHSEVSYGTINDSDDVFVVLELDDFMAGPMLHATHRGDPATPFDITYFQDLSDGFWTATISVRDTTLVVTAINDSNLDSLWSADFNASALTWWPLLDKGLVSSTSEGIMSSYDDLSGNLGFLYYENQILFLNENLNYGCYGCTPTVVPAVPSDDPGGDLLKVLLPLIWALVVLVAIIGGMKGPMEALIIAIVGIAGLTAIIAIVATL